MDLPSGFHCLVSEATGILHFVADEWQQGHQSYELVAGLVADDIEVGAKAGMVVGDDPEDAGVGDEGGVAGHLVPGVETGLDEECIAMMSSRARARPA
ncbi:hypothetical protein ACLMAL_23805 [Nocardia sp. CWNU-33]|uniref:hypothetical protein n=1 Tax=Nocardia sp. CWNU-33 TaxID=3392117 RepID=UPI00398EDDD6